jgi:hypothetical protein
MSNVFQLFGRDKVESQLDSESMATIAVTDILASHAQLAHAIKKLSKHLDALDHITDAVSDSDLRAQYQQDAKRSRESLMNAMLDLSQYA